VVFKRKHHHTMRVVRHHPRKYFFRLLGLILLFAACVSASFFAGIYHVQQQQRTVENDQEQQKQQLTQELTQLRTNADVDRQTIEEMRQTVMTQKAQMAAYDRDLRVYKELLTSGARLNPLGVSFGVFTVFPTAEKNQFNYKLVVQKLSTKDTDFSGTLEFKVVGEQAGKPKHFFLHEISTQVTSTNIPLNFKYFQALEGSMVLPEDFVPKTLELVVYTGDQKNSATTETQLAWPIISP
jgi:Na+-translocating ferredoxin:NAD+ oxidoreductase RnfG subunit